MAKNPYVQLPVAEERKQRELLKRMAEAAQTHYEITGDLREGMKELGEAIGEDVWLQIQSPSPIGAAIASIKAENAKAAEEEAATLADLILRRAEEEATEEERRRKQDDYDAGNDRRAAIQAAKRKKAEREKNG